MDNNQEAARQRGYAPGETSGRLFGGTSINVGAAPRTGWAHQSVSNMTDGDAQMTKGTISMTLELEARHDFPTALAATLGRGNRITRRGWNGSGQYVCVGYPTGEAQITAPFLYLKNSHVEVAVWVPSTGDLFAQDWAIVPIQPL